MLDWGNNQPLSELRPMVWALIPYCFEEGRLSAQTFDNAHTKAELARVFEELELRWVWQPVMLGDDGNLVDQLRESNQHHPTIVFNFCDGVDHWGTPGLSVVRALEKSGVPFTGASSHFYEVSTAKVGMKDVLDRRGVATAAYSLIPNYGPVEGICEKLGTPLMVKPNVSSASEGISLKSKVSTDAQVMARRDELLRSKDGPLYAKEGVFVERYIDGDEYTVLMGGYADCPDSIWNLPPARRAFAESIPVEERFLSYDRYWGYYKEETPPTAGEAFYSYVSVTESEGKELADFARHAYCAVEGSGYGRVDIRRDRSTDRLYCLEVNANCGLSGDDQTSSGCMLALSGIRYSHLVARILNQAFVRHTRQSQVTSSAEVPAPSPA